MLGETTPDMLEAFILELEKEVREECAKECERWPLDPFKMEDSERWGKYSFGNGIAGTCNALATAIRAELKGEGNDLAAS
jgi:hypothetical protein